jgi:hypothetical protein
VNLKQLEAVDMHTGPIPSNVETTKGRSFLTNQTQVTGVQDVITRMKNADQGGSIFVVRGILIFILIIVLQLMALFHKYCAGFMTFHANLVKD